MTISAFVTNRRDPDGFPVGGRGARRRYRAEKRADALERQEAFDAEVARTAREQNCLPGIARDVVRSRRRFEHRTGRSTPITLSRVSS